MMMVVAYEIDDGKMMASPRHKSLHGGSGGGSMMFALIFDLFTLSCLYPYFDV